MPTYKYPRPALTVDCVVFGFDGAALKILLIQRGIEPFHGKWALPGGFIRLDETLDQAAQRELAEEAGLTSVYLEQLYTFSDLNRDPRERVVSVAYYALVSVLDRALTPTTDAQDARWFPVQKIPTLAFDHKSIVQAALHRLKNKVRYEPIGFELLPEKFTLTQLQHLYETVLEMPLDTRNFRKKILKMDLLAETGELEQGVAHRAAKLYFFDLKRYRHLQKAGFHFEI